MTTNEALELLVAKYREYVNDNKLSWDEAIKLFFFAVMLAVRVLEANKDMPGSEKKQRAMAFLLMLYDSLMLAVKLPVVPDMFQALIKNMLREVLAQVASPLIDALVSWWNHYGWGDFVQLPETPSDLDIKALL
jgi:hypothetical protein